MYRIVRDNENDYCGVYIYALQKRFFFFLWVNIEFGSLWKMQEIKQLKESKTPRYTVIE